MLKLKRQFSLLSLLVLVVQLFAQGPNGSGTYYRNANGQKGKSLKTALFKIISTHKDIGYDGLYDCYEKTDKRADGKVWDMYSNTTNYSFSDNVDKDYLALTANDNKLQSSTSAINANAQWTVTVSSDGVATIKNCKLTDREVRYNKSSPRFACYKGTQQTVSLYRRVQSTGIMPVKPSAADSRVDVFAVSGVMVRRQVVRSAALNGLAKGVYIIGGKKYAVE